MKTFWGFAIALSVLVSCSSSENKVAKSTDDADLMKSFDLSNDQFKKFKMVEATPVPTVTPTPAPIVVEKVSPKKMKKVKKAKIAPLVSSPTSTALSYPADPNYPEKYKAYDRDYGPLWKKFTPNWRVGEKIVVKAKYFGITAGHVTLLTLPEVNFEKKKTIHFQVQLKSASSYRMFYEINDVLDCFVDVDTFIPVRYSLIQRESRQSVDDLQLFDDEKLLSYVRYKREKKGVVVKTIVQDIPIPHYFQDSFSVVFFVRGLPLFEGAVYEFPIVSRGDVWPIHIEVQAREEIETELGKFMAWRISAQTKYQGVLAEKDSEKSKSKILFWFADTPERQMLHMEAKVKLGTLVGDVVEYVRGN